MDPMVAEDRSRLSLDHFAVVGDPREACNVKSPLGDVLFLVTCTSIAGCDDYDEIASWGESHNAFLMGCGEHFFGMPKEDWLRAVPNRVNPALFEACFTGWALNLRPDAPDLIALGGKTVRRSGDEASGLRPIHLVPAWGEPPRVSRRLVGLVPMPPSGRHQAQHSRRFQPHREDCCRSVRVGDGC